MDSKRLKLLLLKDVQDLGEQIGKGAYCTVTKMKFRGLTCAGKKFHNILVEDVSEEEKRALLERFADECELLVDSIIQTSSSSWAFTRPIKEYQS